MMSKDDKLTLKIWENNLGYWVYVIYTGDGTIPGSVRRAGGGFETVESVVYEARNELERNERIRACDHEWEPYEGLKNLDHCVHCGIVNWKDEGMEDRDTLDTWGA